MTFLANLLKLVNYWSWERGLTFGEENAVMLTANTWLWPICTQPKPLLPWESQNVNTWVVIVPPPPAFPGIHVLLGAQKKQHSLRRNCHLCTYNIRSKIHLTCVAHYKQDLPCVRVFVSILTVRVILCITLCLCFIALFSFIKW